MCQEVLHNGDFKVKIRFMNNKLQLTDSQIIDLLGDALRLLNFVKLAFLLCPCGARRVFRKASSYF